MVYILVGLGGLIGSVLRYLMDQLMAHGSGAFPYATLTVNLLGTYILALVTTVIFKKYNFPENLQTAVATGLIGSFTTFSTLSMDVIILLQHHQFFLSALYVSLSLFGGLLMAHLGFKYSRREGEA